MDFQYLSLREIAPTFTGTVSNFCEQYIKNRSATPDVFIIDDRDENNATLWRWSKEADGTHCVKISGGSGSNNVKIFKKNFNKDSLDTIGNYYVLTIFKSEHELVNPRVDKVLLNGYSDEGENNCWSPVIYHSKLLPIGQTIKIYLETNIGDRDGIVYLLGE